MKQWVLAGLALACWLGSVGALKQWEVHEGPTEYMSVPPNAAVNALSAGYDAVAADMLYLNFIHYFGKHLRRDKAYFNLEPVLQMITTLDPHFEGAYLLGGLALADNDQIDEAEALWQRGIQANQGQWQYPYQAGMNLFLFGNRPDQYQRAGELFKLAASLPDAPKEARYMEARMYDVTNRKDLAVGVWRMTYERGATPEERAVAARTLRKLGVDPTRFNSRVPAPPN